MTPHTKQLISKREPNFSSCPPPLTPTNTTITHIKRALLHVATPLLKEQLPPPPWQAVAIHKVAMMDPTQEASGPPSPRPIPLAPLTPQLPSRLARLAFSTLHAHTQKRTATRFGYGLGSCLKTASMWVGNKSP